jgi:hypothetical protein
MLATAALTAQSRQLSELAQVDRKLAAKAPSNHPVLERERSALELIELFTLFVLGLGEEPWRGPIELNAFVPPAVFTTDDVAVADVEPEIAESDVEAANQLVDDVLERKPVEGLPDLLPFLAFTRCRHAASVV